MALVDADYVDCVVALSAQLFANTPIQCSLWLLSKSRDGQQGYRKCKGEVLFIDGRKLGALIEGSRKQKTLSAEEVEHITAVYREFKREQVPEPVAGFAAVVARDEIADHRYALTQFHALRGGK
jgi:type I restriction enzyme M protein